MIVETAYRACKTCDMLTVQIVAIREKKAELCKCTLCGWFNTFTIEDGKSSLVCD